MIWTDVNDTPAKKNSIAKSFLENLNQKKIRSTPTLARTQNYIQKREYQVFS